MNSLITKKLPVVNQNVEVSPKKIRHLAPITIQKLKEDRKALQNSGIDVVEAVRNIKPHLLDDLDIVLSFALYYGGWYTSVSQITIGKMLNRRNSTISDSFKALVKSGLMIKRQQMNNSILVVPHPDLLRKENAQALSHWLPALAPLATKFLGSKAILKGHQKLNSSWSKEDIKKIVKPVYLIPFFMLNFLSATPTEGVPFGNVSDSPTTCLIVRKDLRRQLIKGEISMLHANQQELARIWRLGIVDHPMLLMYPYEVFAAATERVASGLKDGIITEVRSPGGLLLAVAKKIAQERGIEANIQARRAMQLQIQGIPQGSVAFEFEEFKADLLAASAAHSHSLSPRLSNEKSILKREVAKSRAWSGPSGKRYAPMSTKIGHIDAIDFDISPDIAKMNFVQREAFLKANPDVASYLQELGMDNPHAATAQYHGVDVEDIFATRDWQEPKLYRPASLDEDPIEAFLKVETHYQRNPDACHAVHGDNPFMPKARKAGFDVDEWLSLRSHYWKLPSSP